MSATRTAVSVLTHTQPEQTAAALSRGREGRAASAVRTLVRERRGAREARRRRRRHRVRWRSLDGEPDLCLVLGGDGTILKALRAVRRHARCPVFGINYGTIGFLAAADPDELDEGLRRAFAGDFDVMPLPGPRGRSAGAPCGSR